ncbi:AI-2E family transporter [Thiocapsa bogorovii]|uniref:AI-2E family transporter n=1 Tax=Thiocapsa bogorovii TaxID=521689 RepID=UPI001E322108|nr:AI-2E family transporter [Thiocapsa bogorovii]UHD16790.1 AI-2E family transporter [Thiocapsa bogorovii]
MQQGREGDRVFLDRAIEAFIRIAIIAILVAWCFDIVRPFIVPFAWAIIIAIGLYPGYERLTQVLHGRRILAAVIMSLLCFALLLVPALLLSASLVGEVHTVIAAFSHESLKIPPLPDAVTQLPLIGDDIARIWDQGSSNFRAVLMETEPELKVALHWTIGVAGGAGVGLLHILVAILIAGFLLAQAEAGQRASAAFARRLAGARGVEFARLSEATIRSVTRGILGVALIQSLLAGLGWLAIGVPAAGLWALLALVMCVVQIGILPITVAILVYVFFHVGTLTFLGFLVWSLFVYSLEHILKPILLGRGVDVPMAVIFVGAIGGFLSAGIIGLFVGSVVLVLGYKLLLAWLHAGSESAEQADALPSTEEPAPQV